MTALHRNGWLTERDRQAHERIIVLNLRHGLSAARATVRVAGHPATARRR
ncbi:hypothetical protein AGRA3207_007375 [Actinomadura graeca]|uniref:Transposase n=1 Tax=Actinomadura graeca TaxID=2750812 RepID=A0ABX8R4Q6_9ACTN|nr:hypothetical protein [Actinomadura graeca]QXJ25818.1 hypothetical protein AGRA3207_007375 [Actinomadura graeca]